MLRIINFRIPVQDADRLEELLIKKYTPLRNQIRAIHGCQKESAYYLCIYFIPRSG